MNKNDCSDIKAKKIAYLLLGVLFLFGGAGHLLEISLTGSTSMGGLLHRLDAVEGATLAFTNFVLGIYFLFKRKSYKVE